MPVPKGKHDIYGRIVGHMINTGKSMEKAKNIADKAVKKKGVSDKGLTPTKVGNIRTRDHGPATQGKTCGVCGMHHAEGYNHTTEHVKEGYL